MIAARTGRSCPIGSQAAGSAVEVLAGPVVAEVARAGCAESDIVVRSVR
jgi:hypothetical protein